MARMPDNPLTRMIEETARHNQMRGRQIESPVGGSLPSSRSASLGREVEVPRLTAAEKKELDAKARELGLLPPEEGEGGPYSSFEEAVTAGAPVERPRTPSSSTPPPPHQMIARLPDFSKVSGIDLIRGVVYVDALEFPIPEDEVKRLREYSIKLAGAAVQQALASALSTFNMEESTSEEVSPLRGQETEEQLPEKQE